MKPAIRAPGYARITHQYAFSDQWQDQRPAFIHVMPVEAILTPGQVKATFAVPEKVGE
jgi:hypothetical protein